MIQIVTLGETLALLSAPDIGLLRHADYLRIGVAGAESNVAIGLCRLGVDVQWTGRVGDDEFGQRIAQTLRGQGLHTRAIVDDTAPTGLMIKARRTSQLTQVAYYRRDSAGSRLAPGDLDTEAIAEASVIHLSGITPALSKSARDAVFTAIDVAREYETVVSFDVNYRSALWSTDDASRVLADVVRRCDVLFTTEDEAALLTDTRGTESLTVALARMGPTQVLVKRGSSGATALIRGQSLQIPPVPVTAVDPVGAGDAFTAGYLADLCSGATPAECVRTAARTGAFAVTVHGDWEGAPTRRELAMLEADADTVLR